MTNRRESSDISDLDVVDNHTSVRSPSVRARVLFDLSNEY